MWLIYKTTNIINSRYYIGLHKQAIPEIFDGYFGSGPILKLAIKKYGKENFIRKTLKLFDKIEDALKYESEIININDPLCYNIQHEGYGGHAGMKWWFNNKTGEQYIGYCPPNNDFNLGRRKNIKTIKGMGNYINLLTGEFRRFRDIDVIPENFVLYSNKGHNKNKIPITIYNATKYVTEEKLLELKENNVEFKIRHNREASPTKNCQWIHNPITGERKQIKDINPIPNGFIKGMGDLSSRKFLWYKNITTNEELKCDPNNIPEGFIKGRLTQCNNKNVTINNIYFINKNEAAKYYNISIPTLNKRLKEKYYEKK